MSSIVKQADRSLDNCTQLHHTNLKYNQIPFVGLTRLASNQLYNESSNYASEGLLKLAIVQHSHTYPSTAQNATKRTPTKSRAYAATEHRTTQQSTREA